MVFKLESPNSGNWIDAQHQWCLPAIDCPKCGKNKGGWGVSGLSYPFVELPANVKSGKYKSAWPISWQEYEVRRKPIQEAVGQWPVPPGTEFGPLIGAMSGPLTDFNWIWNWQCLIRRKSLERLNQELHTTIQGVPAKIKSRHKEPPDYWELVGLPIALLSDETKSKLFRMKCSNCGEPFATEDYTALKVCESIWPKPTPSEPIRVKKSSLPNDVHIFRIREFASYILCTEQFRNAVEKLELQNVKFLPIEIAEE